MANKIKTIKTPAEQITPKKRKTLDSILGINGLALIAIITNIFFVGSILFSIGFVCGISAIYYLFKRGKTLTTKEKSIGWGLVILWLIIWFITFS